MLVYLLSAIETDEDRALFVDLFEKYHDRMEQAALRIVRIHMTQRMQYKMRICRLSVILIKFQRFRVRIGDSGASL